MEPRTKTKPFPGHENPPSDPLDTAPTHPGRLTQSPDSPAAEVPVPEGYFDELLDAAKDTPAVPERPDSGGAKSARFSGDAGVPQRSRDLTVPTGEVLVEPLTPAEARARALATANPSREVDLEAFVRNPEVRRAVTVPSARVREAEVTGDRRRRALVGFASAALVAAILLGAIYLFVSKNNKIAESDPALGASLTPTPPPSSASVVPPPQGGPAALASAPATLTPPPTTPPATPVAAVNTVAPVTPASPPRTAGLPTAPSVAPPVASAVAAPRPSSPAPAPSDITHSIN